MTPSERAEGAPTPEASETLQPVRPSGEWVPFRILGRQIPAPRPAAREWYWLERHTTTGRLTLASAHVPADWPE